MRKKGAKVQIYDKYFHSQENYLNEKYDLITMTEVFEHLWEPVKILEDLKKLLNPDGKIALMTKMRTGNEEDFKNWWYGRDATHVFFLAKESAEKLAKRIKMQKIYFNENVLILKK